MKKVLFSFLLAGMMAPAGVATAQQTVTIVGTGTDSVTVAPVNTVWKGSITENIYLDSELNPNGTITIQDPVNITDLAFYYAPFQTATSTWSHYVRIYLKHVSRSSFTNTSDRELIHADTNWVYNGSLYRINLNNGTTTLVGSSGIHVECNTAMAFDYNTGELFIAAYDDNYNSDDYGKTAMYYVNTSNGEMKYIGKLLNRTVEITAMFVEQTVPQQGIASAQAAELSVYPNPAKDELRVNGVENGTVLLVYDMTGKVVAQHNATENTVINLSGLNKGVYVVAAGERKIKFVKE